MKRERDVSSEGRREKEREVSSEGRLGRPFRERRRGKGFLEGDGCT